MPITEQDLKAIIRQEIEEVMTDLGLLMPYPLDAEPGGTDEEPPLLQGHLNERKVNLSRIIKILNALDDEQRERIFSHFKRYRMDALIKTIDSITKASKGSLKASN